MGLRQCRTPKQQQHPWHARRHTGKHGSHRLASPNRIPNQTTTIGGRRYHAVYPLPPRQPQRRYRPGCSTPGQRNDLSLPPPRPAHRRHTRRQPVKPLQTQKECPSSNHHTIMAAPLGHTHIHLSLNQALPCQPQTRQHASAHSLHQDQHHLSAQSCQDPTHPPCAAQPSPHHPVEPNPHPQPWF